MPKNGDQLGQTDQEVLIPDDDTGNGIVGLDPADFGDDKNPTNPGKKVVGINLRDDPIHVLVEDNRGAEDPEGEEMLAAWDNLGGRKAAKLDGGQPVRGEAPLEESHKDSLIKRLTEARQHGVANSNILALIAEIRRYDPDFDPETVPHNEILGGETSSGPARLEADLASKLPLLRMSHGPSSTPGPVSLWKRRVAQAIAALGLIGVVGVGVYKTLDQLQPSPDETEEAIKVADPTPVPIDEPLAEESTQAATLYDEVGDRLETKTEGTGLSQGTIARIHAASTNDLTESLYDGAKQWKTLDGSWLDTPEAHANVVKKLTTWGGYKDVLTVSANANSIDEMLEDIADSDLPNAEYVAWKVATQIASIKDSRVVPSVEEVQTRLGTVDSAAIDKTLDENIENPPPVPGPSFFADQAEQTGSLDSSIYDAPEPVSFLAKATIMETQAPTAVWVEEEVEEVTIPAPRFEDRFDAIEPGFVKSLAEAKPLVSVFMDPTEAPEPVTLLAKREAEIPDVTEFLEEDPVPKPVPTLLENAKSAFSGLTSRFKSWLS